jgi:predicted GIY-YIG superfamily endonuclease
MKGYHYVYPLASVFHSSQVYTGHTHDLRQRLKEHNAGKVPHTSMFKPCIIRSATAFRDHTRALAFEKYLKSGSGRAFLHRHF